MELRIRDIGLDKVWGRIRTKRGALLQRGGTRSNLADLIDRNAAFAPDKTAIRCAGAELSYGALAQRIAAQLER